MAGMRWWSVDTIFLMIDLAKWRHKPGTESWEEWVVEWDSWSSDDQYQVDIEPPVNMPGPQSPHSPALPAYTCTQPPETPTSLQPSHLQRISRPISQRIQRHQWYHWPVRADGRHQNSGQRSCCEWEYCSSYYGLDASWGSLSSWCNDEV